MKKAKIIIAIVASVVTVVTLTITAIIVCRKLFEKKYFTVNE